MQALFWDLVTGPGASQQAARVRGLDDERVARAFPGATGLDSFGALDVYAQAFFARLLEVLEDQHPGLLTLMGGEDFAAMARAYLAAFPPRSHDIGRAGALLPDMLAVTGDPARPELAELARLERLIVDVFDAPDTLLLTMQRLGAVDPAELPSMRLAPIAAFGMLSSELALDELWAALQRGDVIEPRRRATHLVVWRPALTVSVLPCAADEAALLRSVSAGCTLAELGDELARHGGVDRAAVRLFELVAQWIERGFLRA
jgi:hypothetical protein